jgi:hypothetical protein
MATDGKWYPPEMWTGPPLPGPVPTASPYGGYPTYQTSPYGMVPSTNGMAIASLVCACAGIFTLGLTAILGVIFGFVARSQIRNSNGMQQGGGLALAGVIVGFAVIALGLLIVILAVATGGVHSCVGTGTANFACHNS